MKQPENKSEVNQADDKSADNDSMLDSKSKKTQGQSKEYGGRKDGLDPTRYGDWEKNGRCIDF